MKKLGMKISSGLVGATLTLAAWAGGDIQSGEKLLKDHGCAACHGANFDSPIQPTYPKLAGQHYSYLVHALSAYRDSSNPSIGRQNAIMSAQAQNLTDANINDIAEYLAQLPGSVITHK